MLKTLLGYILSKLGLNQPSVKKAIKDHLKKRINEAEARVREDVEFAKKELENRMKEAVNKFADEKEAALRRQANQLLNRLID